MGAKCGKSKGRNAKKVKRADDNSYCRRPDDNLICMRPDDNLICRETRTVPLDVKCTTVLDERDLDEVCTERLEQKKQTIDVADKAKIRNIVIEAVANTKGLVTLHQIECYISEKYRNFPINSYRRKAIFTRVIADEFYKGQLCVKTVKQC